MRALVTGATGLVGSNLVRALLEGGHKVRALVRSTSDVRSLHGLEVERVEGDVLDAATLRGAARRCDVVFHAAAVFSYWGRSLDALTEIAVDGTRNVLEAARADDVGRVVLTSSSVVLGSNARPIERNEESDFNEPEPSAYTLSKLRQEESGFEIAGRLGLELIAVSPTLVMGAFDYRLSPSNANLVNYLLDPFRSTFLGGCNVVSARDVAAGHLLAAQRGKAGARYILGSENLSWAEIHATVSELAGTYGPTLRLNHTATYLAAATAEAAAHITGQPPTVTRDEAKMSARFYWYSHERMTRLGYAPMPARAALAEALAWLAARGFLTQSAQRRLSWVPEVERSLAGFGAERSA